MKRGDLVEAIAFVVVMLAIVALAKYLSDDCESRGGVLRAYAGCISADAVK